ncbi:AGAP004134-PA-like protein [Anopheles sinensis]|uniref:AGAP004134-PA-like protein n=1 Tax=Anopheles sinensis TaxID=74873 RepID=A0A084VL98_ANOSI|nr:AGAP004134-PA-like protein [Anopheles sinensis]
MVSLKAVCVVVCVLAVAGRGYAAEDSTVRALRKVYSLCEDSDELVKCIKVQALKLTDRALKLPSIKLLDGMSLVRKADAEVTGTRALNEPTPSEQELNQLPSAKVDELLFQRAQRFMDGHQLQLNVPRMLVAGQQETGRLVEEGRKKMKKYLGPFLAAMAIKGGILTMVYHSIAIVAGKALIIGKIALVISAIIGLKKLVTPEGHEKTTYEIVKHPHVQQSHTYSSNHGDFDTHENGQFHRSFGNSVGDMVMQDRAYRAHVPKN